jgi:AraC family transcriptional regulator
MSELAPRVPLVPASVAGPDAPANSATDAACAPVQFSPSDIVRRDIVTWNGVKADDVTVVRREPYEYQLSASCHLLIMAEHAERDDGETLVEGLPRSTLRKLSGRLSFVPRGHRFYGWQKPRVLTRVTYFYIDPCGPLLDPELRFAETDFKPRLFFEDAELWTIAAKLKARSGDLSPGRRQYAEALGILLAHELLRLNNGGVEEGAVVRGGLATWQKRRVADYVEEHLGENLLLSSLAEMARLSPFHFSRSFKQSFGMPPLRYLASRRIERAKTLLASREASVTQVGMAVGFAETSSFTAAFRKHTGQTPTAYRRGLD